MSKHSHTKGIRVLTLDVEGAIAIDVGKVLEVVLIQADAAAAIHVYRLHDLLTLILNRLAHGLAGKVSGGQGVRREKRSFPSNLTLIPIEFTVPSISRRLHEPTQHTSTTAQKARHHYAGSSTRREYRSGCSPNWRVRCDDAQSYALLRPSLSPFSPIYQPMVVHPRPPLAHLPKT